jgi:2-methylcitrate dehydratase
MRAQLVSQFKTDGSLGGFDRLIGFEKAIAAVVGQMAAVDGHDFGPREMNIFLLTEDPIAAFNPGSGNLSNWKGFAYPNMAYGATDAAFLAKRGITGPMEVFEGMGGLMDFVIGKFEIDLSNENLESVLRTDIKKYSAEFHSQTAMEATLELREKNKINPAAIKAINVAIFDVAYNIIGGGSDGAKKHVQTKGEADHSLPYMIAVAVLDGEVTPAQYDPARILKKDVQELLQKVTIRPDQAMTRAEVLIYKGRR